MDFADDANDCAGLVIDSLKFAAAGGRMTGRLALSSMPRLADVLLDQSGSLTVALSGSEEQRIDGVRLVLDLRIEGNLKLRCQRCLGEVVMPCKVENRLLLVPEGEAWPEEEVETDEYDALPASRELSVRDLVEEEVLLALPIVPRHEDCRSPANADDGEGVASRSPFAALAGLKKH